MRKPIYTDIEIGGRIYPTAREAAAALGVKADTVRLAIRRGTLERCGKGLSHPVPMRVKIAGQVFETAKEAATFHGVGVTAVYKAIAEGDPDRIARPPQYNPAKSRPITIGPLTFSSLRQASLALGFSDSHVSKVLRRGSPAAWQRIIGAAMRCAANLSAGRSTV